MNDNQWLIIIQMQHCQVVPSRYCSYYFKHVKTTQQPAIINVGSVHLLHTNMLKLSFFHVVMLWQLCAYDLVRQKNKIKTHSGLGKDDLSNLDTWLRFWNCPIISLKIFGSLNAYKFDGVRDSTKIKHRHFIPATGLFVRFVIRNPKYFTLLCPAPLTNSKHDPSLWTLEHSYFNTSWFFVS